ncbi:MULTISPECIES: hypothetical protein [Cronobacter]|uniref:hypothetical protein n=1 Tax=Cronobacter TaxID=413496 RepID=UPI001319C6BA|nr:MULTISPECIES: hypothetical protein [Cronobacter]NCH99045.1 hypothetical protein [Cronobacter malonaticus]
MHTLNGYGGFFHTTNATTPSIMSNNVSRIIGEISPTNSTVSKYFTLTKISSFTPLSGECYYNVARMVRENGGEPVFGWMLWESTNLIEGEAHCLYRSPEGIVTDITPRVSGETEIFFVEDSKARPKLSFSSEYGFRISQITNPQLDIASGKFSPSIRREGRFNPKEIKVIDLNQYLDSFLFE